jgi:type I restriction-modification system DNA methylase subunit
MSKKDIIKTMTTLSHRHDSWRVFSDFVEMSAVSIANACDQFHPDRDKREARYMEIVKAYTAEELSDFAKMFAMLTDELETGPSDVLGEIFMDMDLGSKWHGQFFTPYSLCKATAAMMVFDLEERLKTKPFITANEPASGGGAMLIALAEEMTAKNINFQKCLHVTAQDLDLKAVHMSYVQFSLLGIPGIVIHGNTLLNEQRSIWHTPMHIMGGWTWKLRKPREALEVPQIETVAIETVQKTAQQGSLF